MSGADFFALVSAMFLARSMSAKWALIASWVFLGLALLKRWAA